MSARFEFGAGFADDLSRALSDCPADGVLADYLPFHEVLDGVDGAQLRQLLAVAAAQRGQSGLGESLFAAPLGDGAAATARPLDAAAVRLLASFDDVAVGPLRRAWWQALGREGEPDPDRSVAIRGLVVQCRAAIANGWLVVAITRP